MATTTLTAGMKRILRELDVGMFIPNAYISALAAASVTVPNFFLDAVMAPDFLQVRNAGLVRPTAATSADLWRPAGAITISTGAIAQTGAAWADTTLGSEDLEIWYWRVRRDQEVLDSLNRVLAKEFVTTYPALSHLSGTDGDNYLTTTSDFAQVGTSTLSKITTSTMTPWGRRSLRTLNSAVNSGARTANVRVRTAGRVNGFTIASTEVGTSSVQGWDGTNSATFGTAVTVSERRPQLVAFRNATVPDTCKVAGLYLNNTSASGDTAWNQQWLYNLDNPVCPLPALVSESFMAPKIIQGRPRSNTGTNTYDGESFDFVPLTEGIDYWLVINQADATPYKVRFRDTSYYDWPLFVEARIPQSTLVTMSAESDAFWNLNQVIPRWKKDLLECVYNSGARRHPDWERQYNLATEQLTEASKARQKVSVAPARRVWSPQLNA